MWLSEHFPKIPLPPGEKRPFTRNLQLEQYADHDFLNVMETPVRARFGAEFLAAMDRCMKDAPTKATFPFLIIHGTADVLTPISGSERFFEAAASLDKQFHKYDGLLHDFMHDHEKADHTEEDIGRFLNAHV